MKFRILVRIFDGLMWVFGVAGVAIWWTWMLVAFSPGGNAPVPRFPEVAGYICCALAFLCSEASDYFRRKIPWSAEEIRRARLGRWEDLF